MSPRVAVLMPVYNGARFIASAIESVLAQTFTDFELLIVIDGATDRSREIADSFDDSRIRIIDNETNIGLPASLNKAMAMTSSEYIARLDADDVAFPNRLETQVAWLDANPQVAVLGAGAVPINSAGRVIRVIDWWYSRWPVPNSGPALEWYRTFYTPFVHSSVVFRRAVIHDVLGGYQPGCGLGEDTELWMRVAQRYEIANLPVRLVGYRKHMSSMTAQAMPTAVYRRLKRTVVHSLMQDVLRTKDVPQRWADLWVAISCDTLESPNSDMREFIGILDAFASRLAALYPTGRGAIAREHSVLLGRIAVRLAASRRLPSFMAFRILCMRNVQIALEILPLLLPKSIAGVRRWRHLKARWVFHARSTRTFESPAPALQPSGSTPLREQIVSGEN